MPVDLRDQIAAFSADEVTRIVRETPSDRAPGPDGFNGCFYKAAWEVLKTDILEVFHSLWRLDSRSFHLLNEADMVLLWKNEAPSGLRDYRPISLIHSVGKLFSKGLAMWLAPRMKDLVRDNQTAFIKGRRIHENFRSVQLACRWLNARRCPCPSMLLKVDLAKAFSILSLGHSCSRFSSVLASRNGGVTGFRSSCLLQAPRLSSMEGLEGAFAMRGAYGKETRSRRYCSSS